MSKQDVPKMVTATICDYCDTEIPTYNPSEWAHIIQEYISEPTKKAKHLIFKWPSKRTYTETRYDFHTECFDKMVKEMLAKKGNDEPASNV